MEFKIIVLLVIAMAICIFCGNYDKEKEQK
jgi:hypothetical protein